MLLRHDYHEAARILVAAPDPEVRQLYRDTLGAAGYDVLESSDGRDALVKALVHRPAALVTELALPLIDGVALCEILRKDRTTAQMPILALAGERDIRTMEQLRTLVDDVLLKPVTPEKIATHAARLLARAAALGRSDRLHLDAHPKLNSSNQLLRLSQVQRRATKVQSHQRFHTTTPPQEPPVLMCPSCDRALQYESSYVGGVSAEHLEQWDMFVCAMCGTFEYRQRTRKLRRLS
jgi:DNA-binding response OmpR family regulator